jgi:glutathione S-transferase/GST-like protein
MTVDLYHFEPNANGGRPIMALNEKGVPFNSHWIDLLNFQQHSPEYLKINPKGQVPTLVHDGVVITESTPMGEYIDEAFEGPPLRPPLPIERWRMRVWSRFADEYLGPSLSMTAWSRFIGPMMRARDPAALDRALEAIPTPERRIAWSTTIRDSFTPAQLAESMRRLGVAAERLEEALQAHPWLAGSTYSLADINVFNMAAALPRVTPDLANPQRTPRLLEWIHRIEERPAIKAALAFSRNSLRPLKT